MADIRTSSMGGVPKGTTADRPANPSVGDVFYNGTLGCLEIYTEQGWVANSAPPGIPDIGTVTYSATNNPYNNASASVAFTPGEGGGLPNSYRATSTPGGFSGTSSTSPITVSGLQSATAYTFSVTGTNNFGTSASSVSSNSITANTVPQVPGTPTLTLISSTSVSVSFTPGATGGSSITNYKYSTDGTNYTAFSPSQTNSPLTISGLTSGNTYSVYIKAVNANGDSVASSASNSLFVGTPTVSGGTLSSDSTYYYRTFTSTDNLVVSGTPLIADILTVAGGGGGGAGYYAGGAGAGGLLYTSSASVPVATHTMTIGAGGGGSTSTALAGSNGINSTAGSLTTAIGGGGGGSRDMRSGQTGSNGGSGGGAAFPNTTGGSATSGQGNAGGNCGGSDYGAAGGGAGAAGSNGNNSPYGANGANGTNAYSSWATVTSTGANSGYYAGGGAGGSESSTTRTGGLGGGGSASNGSSSPAQNGTANTGGGGGGGGAVEVYPGGTSASGTYQKGGNGGAGIIIVRYTKAQIA